MANLPETPTYDAGVYQLETTDPVEGGVNGKDNQASKNLANRTAYLKQRVDGLENGSLIPAATETLAGKIELATIAEVLAGADAVRAVTPAGVAAAVAGKLNASGSAPTYACRAWVNFNGTGTPSIRAAGNVSSVTDLGEGHYRINLATALPDANFAVSGVSGSGSSNATAISGETPANDVVYAANSFTFHTCDTTGNDPKDAAFVSLAIFR